MKVEEKKWKKSKVTYMDWDDVNIGEFKNYNKINHKKMKFVKDLKENDYYLNDGGGCSFCDIAQN